jgi:hypothetical protein
MGRGYSPPWAATHLLLMAQLSRWLEETGLDAAELIPERPQEFLRANHAKGYRFPRSAEGLVPLLECLRGAGVVLASPVGVLTATGELLERFRLYLLGERGLAEGTVCLYQAERWAWLFASRRWPASGGGLFPQGRIWRWWSPTGSGQLARPLSPGEAGADGPAGACRSGSWCLR